MRGSDEGVHNEETSEALDDNDRGGIDYLCRSRSLVPDMEHLVGVRSALHQFDDEMKRMAYDMERLSYSDETMCACGNPGIRHQRDFACLRCIALEAELDELAGHMTENYVQKRADSWSSAAKGN